MGAHAIEILLSADDQIGIEAVAARLPGRYADIDALAHIARSFDKPQVSEFLRRKFPNAQNARSGDLGEILATTYLDEECDYVVGPSRLVHRDHQEWAMRGDDVLAAKFNEDAEVNLIKGESKSRAEARASVVKAARTSLQREDGLPSPHSLTQFAERLLATADAELGDAILKLLLSQGVQPSAVTHLMFLFTGNDPSQHVRSDLTAYRGAIAQRAVILRVQAHQKFVRSTYQKAITDGA